MNLYIFSTCSQDGEDVYNVPDASVTAVRRRSSVFMERRATAIDINIPRYWKLKPTLME